MRSEPEAAVFKGPREGPRLTIKVQESGPKLPRERRIVIVGNQIHKCENIPEFFN